MRIAVHRNSRDDLFDHRWCFFLHKTGHDVVEIDMRKTGILGTIKECDGVMWHYLHIPSDRHYAPKMLYAIENILHIPVWPNLHTRWHFDEKISQSLLFDSLTVPHVKSFVFLEKTDALMFAKTYQRYPIVFKLSVGAGGENVILINDADKAVKVINKMFGEGIFPYTINRENELSSDEKEHNNQHVYYELQKNYVYFQEYIENNKKDMRVTIIGDRAFAFYRHNRANDFRASGSGIIDYDISDFPMEAIKISFELSNRLGFQSMAYDFLLDAQGQPLINEMSYGYVDTTVYRCPGHWDSSMRWHDGHMWPEEAHVIDFVNEINEYNRLQKASTITRNSEDVEKYMEMRQSS